MCSLLAGGVFLTGCSGEENENIPKAEVQTVKAYGLTLDPSAPPQQVVYVLLRSIADDFAAARARNVEAERKAQFLTFSLAAPKTMEQRLVEAANSLNPDLHKTSLGADRDVKLFRTVHYWGPIVGHYLPSFANVDLQTVTRDSWGTITPDGRSAEVYYPVSHDPSAPRVIYHTTQAHWLAAPNRFVDRSGGKWAGCAEGDRLVVVGRDHVLKIVSLSDDTITTSPGGGDIGLVSGDTYEVYVAPKTEAETATIDVELVREAAQTGGPEYWRVAMVHFLGRQFRPPTGPFTVQAYALTLDESAPPQQVASAMLRSLADMIRADRARAKDARASALYRVCCLAAPAQIGSSQTGKGANAESLNAAIQGWVGLVTADLDAIQTDVRPEQIQAATQPDATAEAVYTPPGSGRSITVHLAREKGAGKTYWRVVNITQAAAPPTTPSAATRPVTQPASVPTH